VDESHRMIRPMTKADIPEARRILRLAFGTFAGVPNPENHRSDVDFIRPRWLTDASAAFVAEVDGRLVGSNFAVRWGSFGFFGPLTVHPEFWDKGVGQQLMQPVMECFERWQVTHAGLFTFAESPKHIALYQKFGFWPRFLTALMTKEVQPPSTPPEWSKFSKDPRTEHEAIIQACNHLTDALYPGLSLEREIRGVHLQGVGDTVLLWKDRELAGFAVCHVGRHTEAGDNKCYVKFGAVRPDSDSASNFQQLLDACESYADSQDVDHLDAGMNLARHEAYRCMLAHGFRIERPGVAMHRPNEPGYSRPGVYAIDDLR
jgi:predicted N-acetyltransferase YhbS